MQKFRVLLLAAFYFLLSACAGVASNLQGVAKLNEGNYAEAEVLLKKSLADAERQFGTQNAVVAGIMNNLGDLYFRQLRLDLAEQYFQRSYAIRQKVLAPNDPELAAGMSNLAAVYREQGRYDEAETLLKRALSILEKKPGPTDPKYAAALANLGLVYKARGQYTLAEPLYQGALSINEKAYGSDNRIVANSLNNLGVLFREQGRFADAERVYKRSLAIREKTLGSSDLYVGQSLNNLAFNYYLEGRYDEAAPISRRALGIFEAKFGRDNLYVAGVQQTLANIYQKQGQYAMAEPLYKASLATGEKWLGKDHPMVAEVMTLYSISLSSQGKYSAALPLARQASGSLGGRVVNGRGGDATADEVAKYRGSFLQHLSLLERNPLNEQAGLIAEESFRVSQLEQASGTGVAIAKMAARFAQGDDAIAQLVKRKQDASDRQSKAEVLLLKAASDAPESRNTTVEQQLRSEISRLGNEIEVVDTELNRRFPEYQLLTRADPVGVGQVQTLLGPKEAMIVYTIADDQAWMWVIRSNKMEFLPLRIGRKALENQVKKVRGPLVEGDENAPVDLANLHSLHQSVFAPATAYLSGVDHLMLVPAGPLQSLPFAMLVSSQPKPAKSANDYKEVDWLTKRYALTTLPSVGSIRAFRQFAKARSGQEPFIGFGDPLLKDDTGSTRSVRSTLRLAGLFRGMSGAAGANMFGVEVANVDVIRKQVRLPESADEIKAMAKILKAGKDATWLQDKATESNIKRLDLSKYRMLAFATHGVMANEIGKGMEPGLLMTPPTQGTLADDGYLAAGEIAKLKLNADFVLLSACNTAAGDGSPGAEGMSGLAKAFFYAGSRSLFVSHWPVVSESTVLLTTAMLREYEANPAKGKAEAHRKSMLALMNTPGHPEYAHPLFWAPFVVVGEGGALKTN